MASSSGGAIFLSSSWRRSRLRYSSLRPTLLSDMRDSDENHVHILRYNSLGTYRIHRSTCLSYHLSASRNLPCGRSLYSCQCARSEATSSSASLNYITLSIFYGLIEPFSQCWWLNHALKSTTRQQTARQPRHYPVKFLKVRRIITK